MVKEVGTEVIKDLVKQAVDKQIRIIEEQQKKAEEFVGKKVSSCKTMFHFSPFEYACLRLLFHIVP